MERKAVLRSVAAALLVAASLYGCGGGGGSDGGGGGSSATTVSGVAATGMPMSGSAYLKDAAGSPEMSTTINAQNGDFSFNVSGKTPPFMLRAGSLYSMSGGAGRANVNPLSNLMVAEMGGFRNMSSVHAFYGHPDGATMQAMFGRMSTARERMRDKMRPLLSAYGVTDADPIMGSYTIRQGMDRMFDDVKMTIDADGNVSMMYVNGTEVYHGPMGNMMGGTMNSGNIHMPATGGTTSTVVITPAVARLQVGGEQRFTSNIPVVWGVATANGGSISSDGLYTAPGAPGMYLVRGTAISDSTQTSTATVMVGRMGMMMQ